MTTATQQIEAIDSSLETLRDALTKKQEAKETFGDSEYELLLAEYSSFTEQRGKLITAANSDKINDVKAQLITVLDATIENLGIAELINEQVTRVLYEIDTSNKDSHVKILRINKSTARSNGTSSGKSRDLKGYFTKHATKEDETRLNDAVKAAAANETFEGRNFKGSKGHAENYARVKLFNAGTAEMQAEFTSYSGKD